MKTFSHYQITGPSLDAIVEILRSVATEAPGWSTNEAHNDSYSEMHGEKCFILISPLEIIGKAVSVAFAGNRRFKKNKQDAETIESHEIETGSRSPKTIKMRVTNIFPNEAGEITREQYNTVLDAVRQEVASRIKGKGIKPRFKSGDWKLEDVIPGKTARRMFTCWLQGFPKTFHPSDVERLDFVTIALFRSKSKADPESIGQYLVEDRNWDEKDASLVRNRIITGLQVLAAQKRYWRGA